MSSRQPPTQPRAGGHTQDGAEGQTSPCERQSPCKHSDGWCLTSHVGTPAPCLRLSRSEHPPSLDEIQSALGPPPPPGPSLREAPPGRKRSPQTARICKGHDSSPSCEPGPPVASRTPPLGRAGTGQPRRHSAPGVTHLLIRITILVGYPGQHNSKSTALLLPLCFFPPEYRLDPGTSLLTTRNKFTSENDVTRKSLFPHF